MPVMRVVLLGTVAGALIGGVAIGAVVGLVPTHRWRKIEDWPGRISVLRPPAQVP